MWCEGNIFFRVTGPLANRFIGEPNLPKTTPGRCRPMPVWRECKRRELGKLSSREEERIRFSGSAPESALRKQSARSLQALTQRRHRNVGTDCPTVDFEEMAARTNRIGSVAAGVHELRFAR